MNDTKICNKCGKQRLFCQYSKTTATSSGLRDTCKSCVRGALPRKIDNPLYQSEKHLLRTYGISFKEYNALLESQNRACAICFTKDTKRRFAVDHCHTTGKIRGLLCINCNGGIGLLKESFEIFESAKQYLQRSKHG